MFFRKKSFKAPWDTPLADRIQALTSPSSKKKVVYLYEKADSSTFRYRVYNMCQALTLSQDWQGVFFFENELNLLMPYLSHVSLVVLCRTRWSYSFDHFIEQAKLKKIPLLFDIDDLVFNLDMIPLVMNTLNVSFRDDLISHWFSYASRLSQLGKKCDGTIGTNAYISNHLSQFFQTPNFTIPNFLNQEQIEVSEPLLKEKKRGSPFVLGYFSGSASHANDFAKIAPEIAALLNEFPDMHLNVAGFMEFPPFLKPLVKAKRITHSPFVDYLTLQKNISKADINLIPLVDNPFTQCKSELKFFEAAIVGTITLATPTHVYKHNIEHGETGYLCEEGDWYPTIQEIYKGKINSELTQKANTYCLNKYSPKSQLPSIEAMLNKAICLLK